jgi:hypothetical protein
VGSTAGLDTVMKKKKNSITATASCPACSLVSILTELPWLCHLTLYITNNSLPSLTIIRIINMSVNIYINAFIWY